MNFKKSLPVLIGIIAVLVLFFHPFLEGKIPFSGDLLTSYYAPWNSGLPHKAQGIDVVRQLYPWKVLSIESLKAGQIPFWNPYNFAGNPHMANFQTGVFYPFNIMFLLFDFNIAWTIFIIFQPILVFIFTYLYLRQLKVSCWGAILAGVAFAFCLYMTVWWQWGNVGHSLLWLPAVLWLTEKWLNRPNRRVFLLTIGCLCASILAGYAQTTIYLLLIIGAYLIFRKAYRLILTLFLALGLTAFQWLPTAELLQVSARQSYTSGQIKNLLLSPIYLVTAFAADFFGNPAARNYWYPGTYIERVSYIGVIPLLFFFMAIILGRKNSLVLFWSFVAGLAIFFSLNLTPVRLFYQLNIPLISTTVFTRLLGIFSFAAAVLAGFGLDYVSGSKKKNPVLISLGFLIFYLLLWVLPLINPQQRLVTWRNLVLPTGFALSGVSLIFLIIRKPRFKKYLMAALIVITVFDLYYYFQKITPFSRPESVYPDTPVINALKEKAGYQRFWGYGSGYVDNNFATALKIYTTDGYDPLFIRRYGELISASHNGQIQNPIPRSDVNLALGYGKEALKSNPYRQRLLNLLGVKYILDKNSDIEAFPVDIYQLAWGKGEWWIYENLQALPRAFLAGSYLAAKGQSIVDKIMDPKFDLSKTIILEEDLPSDFILGDQKNSQAEIIDYQSNRVVIKTQSNNNGLLFLSDNYYSGWQAKIDGQPTKIYRADYTFRAITIPAGGHQVVYSYWAETLNLGLTLSLITLITIIITIWRKKIIVNT